GRTAGVVVEVWKDHESGLTVAQLTQEQPLAGEVGDQRLGSRILQHSLHLLLQDKGVFQFSLLGKSEQFVIGNAAPEEERQPRREFDVGDPMRSANRQGRWIAFKKDGELRLGQEFAA